MGSRTGELREYTRDGLTFDVTDRGPVDAPAVVLLHGFPQDRGSWEPISDRLVAAGLRTLAPDQRGYSPGARPTKGYPKVYALGELVADVVALLDAAGLERAHVVGHDWGGALAWAIAGLHPGRVASVTSLSTPHPAAVRRVLRSDLWQVAHSSYMAFFQVPFLSEFAVTHGFERVLMASGLPRASAERYVGRLREPGAATGALGWYRGIAHSQGVLHRCRVPATYVWGRRDPALGRRAAEQTGAMVLGDYRFVEVDEGHWLPELLPDLCAEEIIARVRSVVGGG